jgi:peptidoglycan/xylan/chitin deacetylase (PgdA/CDA1 family)
MAAAGRRVWWGALPSPPASGAPPGAPRTAAAPRGRLRVATASQAQPALAVLVALLLPFGLPFGAGGAAHASARTRLVRATAQPPAVPAPAPLLRIVGCRARTAAAYRGGPHVREVALGFDDGPAADTGAFVSMLERAHASATFFMIGAQLQGGYRSLLLRELRDGDVLGDHTFNHPDLTLSGNVAGQLRWTLAAIRQLSGYTPCVFRPPYGAYNASVVRTAASLGLATVLWNDDPRDWALPGTGSIVRQVLAQVQPGSIVISHDGGGPRGQTLAAYPAIIAGLRARGYRIVTIPQLLGFRPVYRPCVKLCAGLGQPRRALPRDAIIERAP